ncbi:MAG TPA: hypothetical protein VFS62_18530 [Chloroflexota bacterium]|nr:hypothetical protein [Chloroflexota bacterium]
MELLYGYSAWEELHKLAQPKVVVEQPKGKAKIISLPFRARREAGEREKVAA